MNTLKFGNGEWYGKKDTILAYNDENSNFKPLPFSFDRDTTATRVNKDGLIETVGSGKPRVDYKDDSKGALLLEPQMTNYVTQSNDFSGWFKSGAITVTSNYGVSPTGENNSTLLSFSGANNRLYLNTGAAYNNDSVSIYVKGNNGETISFDKSASIGGAKLFTLTGGWDRLESSYNSLSSSRVNIVISTNGGATATNIEVFGIKNEQGSYATSYIPTQGGVVTRLADSCLQGGFQDKNIFGSTQGSVVLEFKWDIGAYVFDLSDALGIRLRIFDGGSDWKIRDYAGASWVNTGFAKSNNVKTKIAFKWNGTEFTTFQDGVKSSSTDSFASSMSIKSITTNKLNNTSNMQFYNTALTDQELIALTTI